MEKPGEIQSDGGEGALIQAIDIGGHIPADGGEEVKDTPADGGDGDDADVDDDVREILILESIMKDLKRVIGSVEELLSIKKKGKGKGKAKAKVKAEAEAPAIFIWKHEEDLVNAFSMAAKKHEGQKDIASLVYADLKDIELKKAHKLELHHVRTKLKNMRYIEKKLNEKEKKQPGNNDNDAGEL